MPDSVDETDDLATLVAARAGDHRAGARLVRRHGASMIRTAWNVSGRYASTEADDVVQEALIAALTTDALPTGDVGAWLRAITVRKALDGLRQRARRAEQTDLPAEPVAAGDAATPVAVLSVRRALGQLGATDRAVLTLVDFEGFSMAEAALALGSTTMAVKWRAVRARRRLKALLESEHD
jgi:RNA polymerase sigma-70 factor, ECF subfamily